ncbi:MAG: hypothetical protein FWH06_04090 [Oscillospiraceae bacterium]|nr:hypothetical protein [Oscillospiraceae bacterium]
MIDVSDLMDDPDFSCDYTVIRTTGKWVKGRFVLSPVPQRLKYYGPVQPATVKEIEQLSTGDQPIAVMKFMCKMPRRLFLTRDLSQAETGDDGAISDMILFRGNSYSIIQVMPWNHFKWMRAFAVLKGGVMCPPSG